MPDNKTRIDQSVNLLAELKPWDNFKGVGILPCSSGTYSVGSMELK
jgi:hypothetical protein